MRPESRKRRCSTLFGSSDLALDDNINKYTLANLCILIKIALQLSCARGKLITDIMTQRR